MLPAAADTAAATGDPEPTPPVLSVSESMFRMLAFRPADWGVAPINPTPLLTVPFSAKNCKSAFSFRNDFCIALASARSSFATNFGVAGLAAAAEAEAGGLFHKVAVLLSGERVVRNCFVLSSMPSPVQRVWFGCGLGVVGLVGLVSLSVYEEGGGARGGCERKKDNERAR